MENSEQNIFSGIFNQGPFLFMVLNQILLTCFRDYDKEVVNFFEALTSDDLNLMQD